MGVSPLSHSRHHPGTLHFSLFDFYENYIFLFEAYGWKSFPAWGGGEGDSGRDIKKSYMEEL